MTSNLIIQLVPCPLVPCMNILARCAPTTTRKPYVSSAQSVVRLSLVIEQMIQVNTTRQQEEGRRAAAAPVGTSVSRITNISCLIISSSTNICFSFTSIFSTSQVKLFNSEKMNCRSNC